MILTNCAACAAPLAHDAPRCVRCQTRYCNATCQHDHWRRGHQQICKKMHRGGNAEQYHADLKYKEAVKVAVEACAEDTKGQTCYNYLEAVHSRTGEGLVRGCACGDRQGVKHGNSGIAHVSCLAEQAKILLEEVEENNLDDEMFDERYARWSTCSLCKQHYHGVVRCALGWACWKTYVGRLEENETRIYDMTSLSNGLSAACQYEYALSVEEANLAAILAVMIRVGADKNAVLDVRNNIACSHNTLGRFGQALELRRGIHADSKALWGKRHHETIIAAANLGSSLATTRHFAEAATLLHETIPLSDSTLGPDHEQSFKLRKILARVFCSDEASSRADLEEALTKLEEIEPRMKRVMGTFHPLTKSLVKELAKTRTILKQRE